MKQLLQATTIITALTVTTIASPAAAAPGLSPDQMKQMQEMMNDPEKIQQMMHAAKDANQCMQNIGEKPMQRLQEQGKKMEQEINKLCKEGKRDEAERRAIQLGKEMHNSPDFKAIQRCNKGVTEVMPTSLAQFGVVGTKQKEQEDKHLCDE